MTPTVVIPRVTDPHRLDCTCARCKPFVWRRPAPPTLVDAGAALGGAAALAIAPKNDAAVILGVLLGAFGGALLEEHIRGRG